MSDPCERAIFTINLRPRLASQAPNVNMIILMEGIGTERLYITIGMRRTMFNIIPSRHRSDMRKWDCCISRARIARKTAIRGRIVRVFIELRGVSIFDLQDQCYIAFNSSLHGRRSLTPKVSILVKL